MLQSWVSLSVPSKCFVVIPRFNACKMFKLGFHKRPNWKNDWTVCGIDWLICLDDWLLNLHGCTLTQPQQQEITVWTSHYISYYCGRCTCWLPTSLVALKELLRRHQQTKPPGLDDENRGTNFLLVMLWVVICWWRFYIIITGYNYRSFMKLPLLEKH